MCADQVGEIIVDSLTSVEVSQRRLDGLTLEVASAGSHVGPLVILLHGFPDQWHGWAKQIEALARQGFRVLAPNQRGYGQSDKPSRIKDYDIDRLANDVLLLADSEGRDEFYLIGHDWGGIIAWWTAAQAPTRVRRIVTVNAPHPGAFQDYVWRSPTQLLRSSYVAFFQVPVLPELALRTFDFALLWLMVKSSSRPGTFDESDYQYLKRGWSQPGALSAMLNYYRAAVRRSTSSLARKVQCPMLMIFGMQDPAEEAELTTASQAYCGDECTIKLLPTCRHWPQREEPEKVNQMIQRFLR
jgi:pimeloyl-ACP methyl ester carboxylesterase